MSTYGDGMIHHRTCPLCEAMCGLQIEVDEGVIASIRGDVEDPLSKGYVCPKGPALKALHEDPDRLRRPMRRVGDRFEALAWEDALDLAAEGIVRTQQAYGRDAMAIYVGNPTVHNTDAMLLVSLLMRELRTHNRYSATSVDQLPHHLVARWMFGHQFLIPVPDLERTDLIWIVGANPVASNGSLMSAPNMRGRIAQIRERGGQVVVVDPRRTETASLADAHLAIRPGTDAWLLGAVARIARVRGRGLGPLAAYCANESALDRLLEPFTVERAAAQTGLDAAQIESLASSLCRAERAVVYGRMGVSTQQFGALCQWLIQLINLLTGNFDRPGGSMFASPALDVVNLPKGVGPGRGSFGRWRTRVRGLPEHGGELPVAALAEEILTEGEGQIRGLLTLAGNPVLSTPHGTQLERALATLDHQVAIDFYLNETTRHATVILPPPSPLQRIHYDVALHHFAVRNTAKYADPLFEPEPGARSEWDILLGLIERLATARAPSLTTRLTHVALRRLGPSRMIDLGLRLGPHGGVFGRRRLSVSALRKAPHGIDLGPLVPRMPDIVQKWQPKVDLAPTALTQDLERLEASPPSAPLVLIGRRHLRSNNSWMHNLPKLVSGKSICTLLMHPDDARARGLRDGMQVVVRSRVGAIEAPLEVTDAVRPGVVSLPHGFGHDRIDLGRPRVALRVAQAHAGVSANDLTDETVIDELAGTAVLNGVPVEVDAATAP